LRAPLAVPTSIAHNIERRYIVNTNANNRQSRTPTARELVQARKGRPSDVVTTQSSPAAAKPSTAVATVNRSQDYRSRYLDEVAPASIAGRMIKFNKEGEFVTHDDGATVPESSEFVVLADQTLIGWVKFRGNGEPPDREMGLLYDETYVMPERETLGDLDTKAWSLGLDNQPADPWQHHQYLVLQDTETSELFTFVTSSKTGRRAVGTLLRHYDRMRRSHPDESPVIRLRKGGFNHSDARVGWVSTPMFVVCGRAPSDSTLKPDTSIGTFLNDELPHLG
jgi:hypothetical protein